MELRHSKRTCSSTTIQWQRLLSRLERKWRVSHVFLPKYDATIVDLVVDANVLIFNISAMIDRKGKVASSYFHLRHPDHPFLSDHPATNERSSDFVMDGGPAFLVIRSRSDATCPDRVGNVNTVEPFLSVSIGPL